MTILCIDTATDDGTVAVARDDRPIASVRWHSAGRHGENLFSHIETALSESGASREELSLIGVVIGPGKFTSLRVGLGTAKGLAFGLGLPIVGVSSLRVLARSIVGDPGAIRVPVMNAYRGDVFSAAYIIDESGVMELVPPLFGPPLRVFGQLREAVGGRPVLVAGQGLRTHAALIEASLDVKQDGAQMSGQVSTADAIVEEVKHVMRTTGPADLDSLEPQYLRPSDAQLPKPSSSTERVR
jgi:tRNA threonylcarbamoyladenosine biosynthesis protein TsaB